MCEEIEDTYLGPSEPPTNYIHTSISCMLFLGVVFLMVTTVKCALCMHGLECTQSQFEDTHLCGSHIGTHRLYLCNYISQDIYGAASTGMHAKHSPAQPTEVTSHENQPLLKNRKVPQPYRIKYACVKMVTIYIIITIKQPQSIHKV